MGNVSTEIADYVATLGYDALPSAVVAAAKRNILDTLLVACAGAAADGVGAILDLSSDAAPRAPSTVWTFAAKRSPGDAALVNAMAAAALDYDSLCLTVHADSVVVPAVVAVAEAAGASGKQLIAAYVAGVEIMARLSRAAISPQKGWSHTAVFGVIGAALAAASIARMTRAEIAGGIGVCLSLAAGSQQANVERSLTKRLQPALAARNGILAADIARAGVLGPSDSFEGRNGFWALYQGGDAALLRKGIGSDYVLLQTALKKFPVCACSHAAIEAVLQLAVEYDIQPDEVLAVEAIVTPFMAYMVGGDFGPGSDPVVSAQFSLRYGLASALLRRHVGLANLELLAIKDPAAARLAERVALTTDAQVSGETAPATVRIRTARHGELSRTIVAMPGCPDAPLSPGELYGKWADCCAAARFARGEYAFKRLCGAIDGLETCDDIGDLVALLRQPGEAQPCAVVS